MSLPDFLHSALYERNSKLPNITLVVSTYRWSRLRTINLKLKEWIECMDCSFNKDIQSPCRRNPISSTCRNLWSITFWTKNKIYPSRKMYKSEMGQHLQLLPAKNELLSLESIMWYVPAMISIMRVANWDITTIGSTPESINSLALFTVSAVSDDMANSKSSRSFSSETTPTYRNKINRFEPLNCTAKLFIKIKIYITYL